MRREWLTFMLPIGFNAPLLSIQCATGWPTLLYNIKKRLLKHCHARAERLTSSEVNYKEEINRVQQALKNNGYPSALTTLSPISNNAKKTTANRSSVVLPYYRGLSEKLQRCLSDHKIKAFFKPMRTNGDKFRNGKDPVHPF